MQNAKDFNFKIGAFIALSRYLQHYRLTAETTDNCSFCGGEMVDDSIRFKGISACAICLIKMAVLDANLREYQQMRWEKYGNY